MTWSVVYGAAQLYWALGGAGYPFAKVRDERSTGSILEPSRAEVVAPVFALFCAAAVVAGVLMLRNRGSGRQRKALLAFGWVTAGVLMFVIPDYFMIGLVAFSPLIVVFSFTGIPGPQGGIEDILFWHRDNLVLVFIGGLMWALMTLAYQRRTADQCLNCGRGEGAAASWTSPDRARRWGRWAVYAAVISTLPYDITRIAWYFGYPLGITDAFLKDMQDTEGMLEIGLALGILSTLGSLLTHGLVSKWGEVWPRWVWFKAGRPVNPKTAIIPATVVALALIPGGVMSIARLEAEMWGANGPMIFWLSWGVALGAATYAYYLRRRGECGDCGRG
ncbi:NYN domain-containing protein [Streptomyces sp. ISL-43]|nr:NYN domain-containing protein [Streptomyces sp. ISL-43]